MACYCFHDIGLDVEQEGERRLPVLLEEVLADLRWTKTDRPLAPPALRLQIRSSVGPLPVPAVTRPILDAGGVRGWEAGHDFYLTAGATQLHLDLKCGVAEARLDPGLFDKPVQLQRTLWSFTLVKLLRTASLYSLHAAGLVSREGDALLIIGKPGSGKSTLTLGLIQHGWSYLSDDAVLLREQPQGVEAWAFRKPFYLDAGAAAETGLPLGPAVPDAAGSPRRSIRLEATYPGQFVDACRPCALLFARIVAATESSLEPVDAAVAFQSLLEQSGPQAFDRTTMRGQFGALKALLRQASAYRLRSGLDLYHRPAELARLLAKAEGKGRWLESSLSSPIAAT